MIMPNINIKIEYKLLVINKRASIRTLMGKNEPDNWF